MDQADIIRIIRNRYFMAGSTLDEIHDEVVPGVCDEETFFLCWMAFLVLEPQEKGESSC